MGGNFEMLNMLQNLFGHILTPSATGLFFLISGFLYFYRVDQFTLDVYKVKSSKRVKTLVVPYLVWCTISASYEFLYQVYQWHASGYPISFNLLESLWCCHQWGEKNLNILGWSMPMYGPADLSLWFLRDLIVVSFCTPIIYLLLRYLKGLLAIGMMLLYVTQLWTSVPSFSIHAFLFFTLGAYMAVDQKEFCLINSESLNWLIVFLAVVSIAIGLYQYPQSQEGFRYIQQTTTILVAIAMVWLAKSINEKYCIVIPNIIDQSSFFVYAIHACGLFIAPTSICLKLEQCSSFQNEWLLCLLYLLSPFMVYGISVVYYYVLNKLFKPIMPVLTGNR